MKKVFNQIVDNPINIKIYFLPWLIVLSLLLRLLVVYFTKDTYIENEWNILFDNLVKYKSFSFYNFDNQLIPSVIVPPLYTFFLYLIKIITSFEGSNLLYAILFIQIILSTYCVYLFYEINQNFFSKKLSLVNSIIFSFFPLNVYACGQISSINLQIVLSLLFLKFIFLLTRKKSNKNIIIFSLVSGLLVLTRGEFIFIFSLFLLFIIWQKKIKLIHMIKIVMIVILVISPYIIRNYIHFNQIFIVKSFGYNLWKGNNELSTVEGYENLSNSQFAYLSLKINNLEKNKYYEINRDKIFLDEAFNNLREDSSRYIKLFFNKLFSYYFIDTNSRYPNYYNFFHIFPIILLSLISIPGIFIFYKKNKFENRCIGLYLFINLIIFSIFFILPRYKLAILPIQIILATYSIDYIIKKIGKIFNNA